VVVRLVPTCRDRRTACWQVRSTGHPILPYHYDGKRRITIGEKRENAIFDDGRKTREHTYSAVLTFDLESTEEISQFTLSDITYEDFVEIVFNGRQVYSDLDRRQYTKTQKCKGCHTINRRQHQYLNFSLLPFLKAGANTLEVTLTAVAHGELYLRIDTRADCCRFWQDVWKESRP